MPRDTASPLTGMRNLGPRTTQWLASIGITTPSRLRRVGPVAAYVRLKRAHRGVSLNALYALVGAVEGLHWTEVRRTRRLDLLLAVDDYERRHPVAKPKADELLALKNIGPAMRRDLSKPATPLNTSSARAECRAAADCGGVPTLALQACGNAVTSS